MILKIFLLFSINLETISAIKVGWKSYLAENPTEFHDLPIQWKSKNNTLIPNWLSGIFVRNGPAQVRHSLNSTHFPSF